METPQSIEVEVKSNLTLCSDFDFDCFLMNDEQHEMCAKSLPMFCSNTGVCVGIFEEKDGHCPFER